MLKLQLWGFAALGRFRSQRFKSAELQLSNTRHQVSIVTCFGNARFLLAHTALTVPSRAASHGVNPVFRAARMANRVSVLQFFKQLAFFFSQPLHNPRQETECEQQTLRETQRHDE